MHSNARPRTYHKDRTIPDRDNETIWVFGSNLLGIHGAGAARIALKYFKARRGVGVGLTGMAYAIPTKANPDESLHFDLVKAHIADFVRFAKTQPTLKFFVTRIGCELAGFSNDRIGPLFEDAPSNCSFAIEWRAWLGPGTLIYPFRRR